MYKNILIIILWSLLVPLLIFIDFEVVKGYCNEDGIVEIVQEILILILSVFCFVNLSKKLKNIGYGLAVFFLIIFIRELDFLFDKIYHGAWFPAALIALVIFGAKYYRDNFKSGEWKNSKEELDLLGRTKDFSLFVLGLTIVLIFSRVIGTGSLWKVILGVSYDRVIKTVMQEGLELYGYGITLLSVI